VLHGQPDHEVGSGWPGYGDFHAKEDVWADPDRKDLCLLDGISNMKAVRAIV